MQSASPIPVSSQQKKKPPRKSGTRQPRAGSVLDDRFKVIGRALGKGGMGTVLRVEDQEGDEYAVKRLDPALRSSANGERRFRQEFEAARALGHPNIVDYIELFEDEDTLNIRMELVEGVSLRKLMSKHKVMEPALACGVAAAICRALHHMHEAGIVHRDLKPANVLVSERGEVKLTDFGISRVRESSLTRTGTLLGTPRYMSPEQLSGRKGGDIVPQSDLFALGVLLYELLVGKDPHRVKKRAEVVDVIEQRRTGRVRDFPEEVSRELSVLVKRLLVEEPDVRGASAEDVGRELGEMAYPDDEVRLSLAELVADAKGGNKRGRADKPTGRSRARGKKAAGTAARVALPREVEVAGSGEKKGGADGAGSSELVARNTESGAGEVVAASADQSEQAAPPTLMSRIMTLASTRRPRPFSHVMILSVAFVLILGLIAIYLNTRTPAVRAQKVGADSGSGAGGEAGYPGLVAGKPAEDDSPSAEPSRPRRRTLRADHGRKRARGRSVPGGVKKAEGGDDDEVRPVRRRRPGVRRGGERKRAWVDIL